MRAMLRRERSEKYQTVALFARLIGQGLGLDEEHVEGMIDLYLLELSQDRYRPKLVQALREARSARQQKAATDEHLLKRVQSMDVGEAELEAIGAKKHGPGGRRKPPQRRR